MWLIYIYIKIIECVFKTSYFLVFALIYICNLTSFALKKYILDSHKITLRILRLFVRKLMGLCSKNRSTCTVKHTVLI